MQPQRRVPGKAVRLRAVLLVLSVCTGLLPLVPTPAAAIYAGKDANIADFPWMASLQQQRNGRWEHTCGATLIDSGWILTAAHCVWDSVLDKPKSGFSLRVIVGTDMPWGEQDLRQVGDPVFPLDATGKPSFDTAPYWQSDVALLPLLNKAKGVPTLQLAFGELPTGSSATALGWGSVADYYLESDPAFKLQRIDVLVREDSECQFVDNSVAAAQICTKAPDSAGTFVVGGPRHGDSGGPLLLKGPSGWTQLGIASHFTMAKENRTDKSGGDGDPNYLGWSSVQYFRQWITDTVGGRTNGSTNNTDSTNSAAMALIIDSSGSMADNDPSNKRIVAGKTYLTAAAPNDVVGIVDFDDTARIASEALNPRTRGDQLRKALDTIDSSGGTDIGAGVQGGCDLLSRSGNQPTKAAILLTDGDGSYSNQNKCFVDNGWKLYTFGLGSAVKESLLTTIATQTGGRYKSLASVDNLVCEFQRIRAEVAGSTAPACGLADLIKVGQTIAKTVQVSPRLLQTVFSIAWPGSDIDLTLTSPSGRRITVKTVANDVYAAAGSTYKTINVQRPEPGSWKVELLGVQVSPGGEPVSFSSIQVPLRNVPPIAAIGSATLTDRSNGTYSFTSTGSKDDDGQIVKYEWDFGDGSKGSGSAVEHRFARPGRVTVRLTVTDNDGGTAAIAWQIEVPPFLKPVVFTLAGQAGQSAIYATGTPKNGKTEGTVLGVVRGQPIPSASITEAGLTTIGGNEVLVVRFTVGGVPWELRYRNLFYGIGTVEVCGPAGCETGTGVRFDTVAIPLAAFTPYGITIPGGGTGAPAVSTTQARCAQLQAQLDVTTVQSVRLQLITAMRAQGCPP